MLVNIKSYSAIQQAVPVAFSHLVCERASGTMCKYGCRH